MRLGRIVWAAAPRLAFDFHHVLILCVSDDVVSWILFNGSDPVPSCNEGEDCWPSSGSCLGADTAGSSASASSGTWRAAEGFASCPTFCCCCCACCGAFCFAFCPTSCCCTCCGAFCFAFCPTCRCCCTCCAACFRCTCCAACLPADTASRPTSEALAAAEGFAWPASLPEAQAAAVPGIISTTSHLERVTYLIES